jgi:hypothetical protein
MIHAKRGRTTEIVEDQPGGSRLRHALWPVTRRHRFGHKLHPGSLIRAGLERQLLDFAAVALANKMARDKGSEQTEGKQLNSTPLSRRRDRDRAEAHCAESGGSLAPVSFCGTSGAAGIGNSVV